MACYHKNNDFLGEGSIVGEQSILVNRPRGSYVICESDIQCYFISAEDMHGLMLRYPAMEENLWRLCSVRMAQSLLIKSIYKTKTFEELKLICEKSILATLVPETGSGVFEIDDLITDVVVIYGELKCFPSNAKIVGPKLVVKNSLKLHLITPCKLLIILKSDHDIDLAAFNSLPKEATKSAKSESLLSAANSQDLTGNEVRRESSVGDMKLSCVVNTDPNPVTREEYEKKKRLGHLKEAIDKHADVSNNQDGGTGSIGKEASASRLTPIENVDIEKKIE